MPRYSTIPRKPPQVFLVVDNSDREVTRLATLGMAASFAAKLDEQQPEHAPYRVVSFRDLRRTAA